MRGAFVEPGSASACHGAGKVMGHPAPSWMWGAFGAMKAKNGFALFSGFVSASRTHGTEMFPITDVEYLYTV